MPKRKNHTNRNASWKAHKNGIKQPKGWKQKRKLQFRGMKGMDPKFRRNMKFAIKGTIKAERTKRRMAARARVKAAAEAAS